MAEVIRRAVIELAVRTSTAQIKSPDLTAVVRAREEVAKASKAAEEASKASAAAMEREIESTRRFGDAIGQTLSNQKEAAQASRAQAEATRVSTQEQTRSLGEFSRQAVAAFNKSGQAAFQMARGIAFLSASGQDDLAALTQKVVIAQGAFDVLAGGSKAIAGLAAAFGPVGIAVAAAALAAGAGAVAWQKYRNDLEATKREAKELADQLVELSRQQEAADAQEAQRRAGAAGAQQGFAGLRVGAAATGAGKVASLRESVTAIEQQEQELAKERRRRLRGFRGGTGEESFGQLLEFGSTREQKLGQQFEQRQLDLTKSRYDVEKQLRDQQLQNLESQKAAAIQGAAGLGGLFGSGVSDFNQRAIESSFEAQERQVKAKYESLLNGLVDTMEQVQQRNEQLQQRLSYDE